MDYIDIIKFLALLLAFGIAVIGHEIMHGLVAYLYGDTTAKEQHRLSINPLRHIDMVGTIIVPISIYFLPMLLGASSGFLFGWAKPVPINSRVVYNKAGYSGLMQVDLAGIVFNFTLAAFASVLLTQMSMPKNSDTILYIFGYIFVLQLVVINVVLGVFNLLPVPQFDGAQFITHLSLKNGIRGIAEFYQKYNNYSLIIVLIILMTPIKDYVFILPVQIILSLLTS